MECFEGCVRWLQAVLGDSTSVPEIVFRGMAGRPDGQPDRLMEGQMDGRTLYKSKLPVKMKYIIFVACFANPAGDI